MTRPDEDLIAVVDGAAEFFCQERKDAMTAKALRLAALRMAQTRKDVLVLTLRLMVEDESSFAPETSEVMKRWKPEAENMREEF